MKICVLVRILLPISMSVWLSKANLETLLRDKEKQKGSVESHAGMFESEYMLYRPG